MKVLKVKFKQIGYTGENIGKDIEVEISVKEKNVFNRSFKLEHGDIKAFDDELIALDVNHDISLPVKVKITEQDPVYDDVGQGASVFNVKFNGPKSQLHSFDVIVIGDPRGDHCKKAVFPIFMEAELEY